MKTIFRTKRPQNKYNGLSILLLIAVFGFFIGGIQTPTGEAAQASISHIGSAIVPVSTPVLPTEADDIGGQKIPQDPNPLDYASQEIGGNQGQPKDPSPFGLAYEIGGQRVPGDSNPLGTSQLPEIGGQQIPRLPISFNSLQTEIGGNQSAMAIGGTSDIGGTERPRPTLPFGSITDIEIGGNQGEPRSGEVLGIGGQTVPRTGDSGIAVHEKADIGGTQGAPRVPTYYNVTEVADIGGNITPRTSTPVLIPPFMETEIGGNQGAPKTPGGIVIGGQNQDIPKDSIPLGLYSEESDMDSCLILKYKRRL